MKFSRFLFGMVVASALLTGCEVDYTEELREKLEVGGNRLVIDARLCSDYVDGIPVPARVFISRSAPALDPLNVQWVNNATVVMSDDQGRVDTLTFLPIDSLLELLGDSIDLSTLELLPPGSGVYIGGLEPIAGRTYTCTVNIPGEPTYTATTQIPVPILLDSLGSRYREEEAFFAEGWYIRLLGQDPPGRGQNYLIRYWRNDTLQGNAQDITLQDDEFVDGNYIDGELFADPFVTGDTVTVEFHTVSRDVYTYYLEFQQIVFGSGSPFSGPGANPTSNWNNEALGLFWASTPQILGIRVPGR